MTVLLLISSLKKHPGKELSQCIYCFHCYSATFGAIHLYLPGRISSSRCKLSTACQTSLSRSLVGRSPGTTQCSLCCQTGWHQSGWSWELAHCYIKLNFTLHKRKLCGRILGSMTVHKTLICLIHAFPDKNPLDKQRAQGKFLNGFKKQKKGNFAASRRW